MTNCASPEPTAPTHVSSTASRGPLLSCLLIHDFGLQALNETERRDLLEFLEDRYGRRATLVSSQLPIDHWHDIVGDAILDRLVHHAHRIHPKGASMRRLA